MPEVLKEQDAEMVFALDIGTRSIIGMLGRVEKGRFHVEAIEKEEHGRRAMLDGQIVEIEQVAQVAGRVISRLQEKTGIRLKRVCVAAAGRALKSQSASFTLQFDDLRKADEDVIGQLEAGAVSEAEKLLVGESAGQGRFYMVGYTARQYIVDGYPMTNLMDHRGHVFEADVVSTFLPSGVVESLYAVTSRLGLEVSSLTLEPIAALNAAIPADIRLLNLVLVDIGAGTSDIAVCREGSVVGYTMATVAGDEITELLMRSLLIDFQTGERLKMGLGSVEPLTYPDILGIKHEITSDNLYEILLPAAQRLAKEIAGQVLKLNGTVPSAVFLAGGGSKLMGLPQLVAAELEMSEARVALAGNHFGSSAWSDEYELNDPEYATPLGIGASAALGMINDSYMVTLNGFPAKLFRNGTLNLRDVLLMNGFHYGDMMGRTGANLSFTLNGQREFLRGMPGVESKMRINGQEAEFTTVVRAGDRIEFIPAKPGQSASMTLAQLLGEDFPGTVTVNDEAKEMEYSIRQGDAVVAVGGKIPVHRNRNMNVPPPEPVREELPSPPNGRLELGKAPAVGAAETPDAPKEEPVPKKPVAETTVSPVKELGEPNDGKADAGAAGKAEPVRKAHGEKASGHEEPEDFVSEEKETKVPVPEYLVLEDGVQTAFEGVKREKVPAPAGETMAAPAIKEPVKERAAAPKAEAQPKAAGGQRHARSEQLSFGRAMQVVLNGEPIRLEAKPEGGDHYLMDLLERSGLDFSHLDRPVDLLVNGVEGQFSQILKPNDQVTIRYRDTDA